MSRRVLYAVFAVLALLRGCSAQAGPGVNASQARADADALIAAGKECNPLTAPANGSGSCFGGRLDLLPAAGSNSVPVNFTVALLGDQSISSAAKGVLQLIKNESAALVLHQGDFDYVDSPSAWEQQINSVLGAGFPYFASIGNHDQPKQLGYQAVLSDRLRRLLADPQHQGKLACRGSMARRMVCSFHGLSFVLSDVGVNDTTSIRLSPDHSRFISAAMDAYGDTWRICSWHKNQRLMQLGDKTDETGWAPYEACRLKGAIIATGHEHSYSRTHTMLNFTSQAFSASGRLTLSNGTTFAFVSGVGGIGVRACTGGKELNPWWASALCAANNLTSGALFCKFNLNGVYNQAYCYFKQAADGSVRDEFFVESLVSAPPGPPPPDPPPDSSASTPLVAIVAPAVGGGLMLALLAVAAVVYLRRRARGRGSQDHELQAVPVQTGTGTASPALRPVGGLVAVTADDDGHTALTTAQVGN